MTQSITQLFTDKKLDDIIYKLSTTEYDLIKSELFSILLHNNKVEGLKTYDEQIYYCIRIIKNTMGINSSYHKEFRNFGQTKKWRTGDIYGDIEEDDEYNDHHRVLIDKINDIVNREIPWYEAHIFRLYYLPFEDPNCDQQTYSMRDIEKMHTCGTYRIDHVSIHYKLKKTLTFILKRLKEEGILKEEDIKTMKVKNIFKSI